ncbi:mRNA-capping enzyme subunit alpha [Lachnellula willkommii]|uniref:mRNA-capping enzyme subunit alpha n=1 Tax=Lachnellula willkommii TaxID=215461 RepID=A0A559M7U2_9HELO|nr:mRNA-capping enzyme subunit alpha [Lachnellula willkommii]
MANVNGPVRSIEAPGVRIDGQLLRHMQSEVASLLDRPNNSFPGAQPVSFARKHLEELTRQDYYVCEKSDGMRYLLYLTRDEHEEEAQYLIDRKNDYWFIPKNGLHFPVPRHVEGFHTDTLIDGELVLDKLPNGGVQPKYLVFDCMLLDGNSLMNRTLDKRLAYFKERIYDPYKDLLVNYPEEKPYMHFIMEMKQMQFSYAIDLMFGKILPHLPHGNDGLIFTCRMSDYKFGTDQNILKWKPEAENSIDFRMTLDFPTKQPDEQDIAEGYKEPYVDYDAMPVCNLHVHHGDSHRETWYGEMYIENDEWERLKSLEEPLNDRIVECYMDSQKRWRYMRFRDDKTNANHTTTVDSVIESIMDRVTKQDLMAAQKVIRDEWKKRAAEEQAKEKKMEERKRVASTGINPMNAGAKRKAEEQGNGRPSPGPPVKKEL